MKNLFCFVGVISLLHGCAGIKVVHPDQPKNEGTLAYDAKSGKLVETFTCTMVAGNGKRVSVVGNSEDDARKEALAKCKDQTVISVCSADKVSCKKN